MVLRTILLHSSLVIVLRTIPLHSSLVMVLRNISLHSSLVMVLQTISLHSSLVMVQRTIPLHSSLVMVLQTIPLHSSLVMVLRNIPLHSSRLRCYIPDFCCSHNNKQELIWRLDSRTLPLEPRHCYTCSVRNTCLRNAVLVSLCKLLANKIRLR